MLPMLKEHDMKPLILIPTEIFFSFQDNLQTCLKCIQYDFMKQNILKQQVFHEFK